MSKKKESIKITYARLFQKDNNLFIEYHETAKITDFVGHGGTKYSIDGFKTIEVHVEQIHMFRNMAYTNWRELSIETREKGFEVCLNEGIDISCFADRIEFKDTQIGKARIDNDLLIPHSLRAGVIVPTKVENINPEIILAKRLSKLPVGKQILDYDDQADAIVFAMYDFSEQQNAQFQLENDTLHRISAKNIAYINHLEETISIKDKRLSELELLINNPELDNFIEGVKIEAAHQTERWTVEDEERKPPHHYIMVYTKLLGKLSISIWDKDIVKFKHHLITLAASGFNCHRQIEKKGTEVNNWFAPTLPQPTK